jgi:hypothetical protein
VKAAYLRLLLIQVLLGNLAGTLLVVNIVAQLRVLLEGALGGRWRLAFDRLDAIGKREVRRRPVTLARHFG